ncbi:MAG TPA: hypothetical protein VGL59_16210 [Polyangia bacterium]
MFPEFARRFVLVFAAAALFAASCGGGSDPVACPVVDAGCPSPAPSYANDVEAIIQSRCGTCHSPTGVESVRPYQTYAQVKKFQIDILIQTRSCRMPPAGAAPLLPAELTTLLGWLYCDGPQN